MSAEDAEESQSEGGAGGPGAPTPLSVLEVYICLAYHLEMNDTDQSRESPVLPLEILSSLSKEVLIPSNR